MPRKSAYFAALSLLCGSVCAPAVAEAQLAPTGATFLSITMGVRGNASAHDSRNGVFLTVGAYGSVVGRLVRQDGTFASDQFQIDAGTGFAHYPSVAYSPDADSGRGGYLVTWHSNIGAAGNRVHARLVSASGALLGAEQVVGTEATWWESAAKVEYATVSKVFMATWRTGAYQIRAARFNNAGQPVDGILANPLVDPTAGQPGILVTTTGGERDPSIAYDPTTDNFLVSYSDFLGGAHVYSRLVAAASGAVGAVQLLSVGTATYITDSTYSVTAHKFLVGWYQLPGGTTGRFVAADGTPSGNPFPLSSRFGSYDSIGLAYNPVSTSTLAVGQDLFSAENGGVEVSDSATLGANTGLTFAGGPTGNFYPEVSSSTSQAKWLLTTAHNFTSVVGQFATSTAAGPPPPPPVVVNSLGSSSAGAVLVGSSVLWTAVASGGTSSLVYEFQRWRAGTGWQTVRPYSSANTATIVAVGGTQGVRVNVRQTTASTTEAFRESGFFSAPTTPALSLTASGGGDLFAYNATTGGGHIVAGSLGSLTETNYGTGYGPGNIVVTADFNGDGQTDLFVYNPSTGVAQRGLNLGASQFFFEYYSWSPGLTVVAGDFNGDGRDDIFTYSKTSGVWAKYLTDSANVFQVSSGLWSLDWEVYTGDFNGDGITDIFVYNKNAASANAGRWFKVINGPNGAFAGYYQGTVQVWSTTWTVIPGDYDGDGKTDLFLYGPDGRWYKVFFPTLAGPERYVNGQWSLGWTPSAGDFDGDGRTDIFVYNSSTGRWFVVLSTGDAWAYYEGPMVWSTGWVATVTDVNRDRRADLIVYNPASGRWYELISSGVPAQFGYYTGTNFETGLTIVATGGYK